MNRNMFDDEMMAIAHDIGAVKNKTLTTDQAVAQVANSHIWLESYSRLIYVIKHSRHRIKTRRHMAATRLIDQLPAAVLCNQLRAGGNPVVPTLYKQVAVEAIINGVNSHLINRSKP